MFIIIIFQLLFNRALIHPTQKPTYKNNFLTEFQLFGSQQNLESVSIGYNCLGKNTILIHKNKLIKAIACCIQYAGKLFTKHFYEICFMKLSTYEEKDILISCSYGNHPEIIIWQVCDDKLEFMKKMHQPRKSQGVSQANILTSDSKTIILSLDKIVLHKSTVGYLFDIESQKKLTVKDHQNLKFSAKIYTMCSTFIQNQNVWFLIYGSNSGVLAQFLRISQSNENQIQAMQFSTIFQCNSIVALKKITLNQQNEEKIYVLAGDREGNLYILEVNIKVINENQFTNTTKVLFQSKVHKGWLYSIETLAIESISLNGQMYAISFGVQDNYLKISKINIKEPSITQVFSKNFQIYGMTLSVSKISENECNITIGFRNNTYLTYKLLYNKGEFKLQQIQSLTQSIFFCIPEIKQKAKHSQKFLFKNRVAYNRHSQSLVFSTPRARKILICSSDFKKITNYELKKPPICLDAYQTNIVYASKKTNINLKATKKLQNSSMIKFGEGSILYWENYLDNILIDKVQVKDNITVLKVSWDGKSTVIGTDQGQLFLLKKQNDKIEFFDFPENHTDPVKQLYWSTDSSTLISASTGQVFYWNISTSLQICIQSVKQKVHRDTQFDFAKQLCSYNFRTKQIWEKLVDIHDMSTVSLIKIKGQQQGLLCSMDGKIRIYGCPSKKQDYKQYCIDVEAGDTFHIPNKCFGVVGNFSILVWKLV